MQKSIGEASALRAEREKLRLIYDHYTHKVAAICTTLEKKRARNPKYVFSPKKLLLKTRVRTSQNDQKLKTATENFQSLTAKCMKTMSLLMETAHTRVAPIIAKVTIRQIVELQIDVFAKSVEGFNQSDRISKRLIEASNGVLSQENRVKLREPDMQLACGQTVVLTGVDSKELRHCLHNHQASELRAKELEGEEDCDFNSKRLDSLERAKSKTSSPIEMGVDPAQTKPAYCEEAQYGCTSSKLIPVPLHPTPAMPQQIPTYSEPDQITNMERWMAMMMISHDTAPYMLHNATQAQFSTTQIQPYDSYPSSYGLNSGSDNLYRKTDQYDSSQDSHQGHSFTKETASANPIPLEIARPSRNPFMTTPSNSY